MKEQIEEMAKVIKSSLDGLGRGSFNFTGEEISAMFAEALYNAGYRKQEWISVDDGLPDNSDQILIYLDNGNIEVGYYATDNSKFYHFLPMERVVYWMPLPEPPKMKGGE